MYKFSPYKLVWNGDYYYAVGLSDKYDDVGCFRVDRISKIPEILKEKAVPIPRAIDINTYLNSMFRMYNGDRKEVELVCADSVMDSIIDRLGEDVKIYANDINSFRVIAKISVSHIFFCWIFGFCGKVRIKTPVDVRDEYVEMLNAARNDAILSHNKK